MYKFLFWQVSGTPTELDILLHRISNNILCNVRLICLYTLQMLLILLV